QDLDDLFLGREDHGVAGALALSTAGGIEVANAGDVFFGEDGGSLTRVFGKLAIQALAALSAQHVDLFLGLLACHLLKSPEVERVLDMRLLAERLIPIEELGRIGVDVDLVHGTARLVAAL